MLLELRHFAFAGEYRHTATLLQSLGDAVPQERLPDEARTPPLGDASNESPEGDREKRGETDKNTHTCVCVRESEIVDTNGSTCLGA